MTMLQFSLNDYIAYIFISDNKRLLVEGSDDNRLFNRLLDVFDKERKLVEVDDASQICGFEISMGNREKVELVCNIVKTKQFSTKIVGFVDREFRMFSLLPELDDNIKKHNIDGRVVWTRGHSIENYYFDFNTLSEPISTLSTTPYYQVALKILENNLQEIIRIACAISLVGFEIGNFGIIKSAMSWNSLTMTDSRITVSESELRKILEKRNTTNQLIEKIITRFGYWKEIVDRADYDIVRWMCHGHIGLTIIWSAYKQIVYVVSKKDGCLRPEREVEHALDTKDEVRFNSCASKWIQRSLGNEDVFPYEILKMLELVN